MEKSLNTEALIWKRILETTDLEELEMLLHLVIKDEETRNVILEKVKNYGKDEIEVNLTINTCKK